jgi:transposase
MQLVERHVIKQTDPRFAPIDAAAFASKNLYNAALYVTRQAFIHEGRVVTYEDLARDLRASAEYRVLPAKVAQWVLRQVALAWSSYFAACQSWQADPTKFLGHPKLPKYLLKQGRNLLTYTEQAISRAPKNRGYIVPSGLGIRVQTRQTNIDQARIVPRIGFCVGYYVVEVVYEREPVPAAVDPVLHAGCDIGLTNLATLASDKPGFVPRLVNGRPVKSINQYYNKRRAALQSQLADQGEAHTSQRLERSTTKRTRRIDHYLHTASRRIIDLLVAEGIA